MPTQQRAATVARCAWIGGAIVALTLLTFFQFPGRTYLQSDTQIYLPILERLWDPAAFTRELLAQHPHVSFTIYDEVTLGLRRLTGLDFETVLAAQQFLFRALGILGVFLLARALRLSTRMALLVAATFSLGAAIAGPTVLTLEYEPVPRGFAVLLVLFAAGLAANGRDFAAGIAVSLGFLYHAPSVIPFWIVYFCLTLCPSKPAVMSRRIWGLVPILGGVLVLLALSRLQAGASEPQAFLGRIDPELERIQRLRAPYCWVSLWAPEWIWHYLLLWAASLAAFWRVRRSASQDARFFLIGLPLVGVLAMPVSYLLLDQWKWILMPQIQPARAVLFVAAMAGILAAIAAVKAGGQGRWWESALWFLVVFAIPVSTFAGRPLPGGLGWLALGLALVATLAVWAESGRRKWAPLPWAAAVLVPFFLIPAWGVPKARTPENANLAALAAWARSSTPKDAVFLFPDAGREVYPGTFRARALRAVYVDWKSGGQVNFLRSFAREWWTRWQRVGAYPAGGIDYLVLKPAHRLDGRAPVFENSGFVVYETRGQPPCFPVSLSGKAQCPASSAPRHSSAATVGPIPRCPRGSRAFASGSCRAPRGLPSPPLAGSRSSRGPAPAALRWAASSAGAGAPCAMR
jgi:hypothetical protein